MSSLTSYHLSVPVYSFSSVQVTILSLILQYLSISNYPQLQFLHQYISSQYRFFSVFTYFLSSQCSSLFLSSVQVAILSLILQYLSISSISSIFSLFNMSLSYHLSVPVYSDLLFKLQFYLILVSLDILSFLLSPTSCFFSGLHGSDSQFFHHQSSTSCFSTSLTGILSTRFNNALPDLL